MPTAPAPVELPNPAFRKLTHEVQLDVARTHALLTESFEAMLKEYGLSIPQFNVLRILRGAGGGGLCRNEVRDRLLTRMPDVTRLLDRMEEAGLVTRVRSTEDRRLVTTQLTPEGRALVDRLDVPVEEENHRRLGHLTAEQLRTVSELLTLIRRSK